MPIANSLVNESSRHKILSFMDGHSGYNEIFIAEEDVHKTAFVFLDNHAFWVKKCQSNVSKGHE